VIGLAFGACAPLGAPRWVRVAVSLATLAGFVVLVTPEASVIRAAAMAVIAMLAVLLGRAGAGVSVLSLAVVVLVIDDPWLARSFGFVLSVAATGALLLLAGPLARGLERWMPGPIALALAVPLAAQLACGPIIVLFAPQVALYGVLANIVAGPAAPIATVVGLGACLVASVPMLGAACAWLSWLPSAWIAQTSLVFARLPRAQLAWWEGAAGFAVLSLIGAAAAVLIIVPPGGRGTVQRAGDAADETQPDGRGAGRLLRAGVRTALRPIAAAVLVVAVGIVAGRMLVASSVLGPLTVPGDWSVAACDVGQGDALVVRSAGAVMLIDTGPEPEPLRACLDRLGIARADLLVLTHFDADHTGGAGAVAGRVGLVLHGPEDERTAPVLALLGDPAHQQVAAGQSGVLGDAAYVVRWPAADAPFEPGNDASVVIDVGGAGVPRSLFLGDLSEQSQAAMLRDRPLEAAYDIVKVAHHGSADQLFDLYRDASPALALVTVGENDYGHPRDEILDVLASSGASIARTDRSGLVLVAESADGLRVWRERAG